MFSNLPVKDAGLYLTVKTRGVSQSQDILQRLMGLGYETTLLQGQAAARLNFLRSKRLIPSRKTRLNWPTSRSGTADSKCIHARISLLFCAH
jgi:hypothetical protein